MAAAGDIVMMGWQAGPRSMLPLEPCKRVRGARPSIFAPSRRRDWRLVQEPYDLAPECNQASNAGVWLCLRIGYSMGRDGVGWNGMGRQRLLTDWGEGNPRLRSKIPRAKELAVCKQPTATCLLLCGVYHHSAQMQPPSRGKPHATRPPLSLPRTPPNPRSFTIMKWP